MPKFASICSSLSCPRRNRTNSGSPRAGSRRTAGRELLGVRLLDALAHGKPHEAGDLDRPADLSLGFLERLRDRLLVVVYVGLLEQADLLVEGLEPRFDDLGNDVFGLALLAELVGEHVLLALDHRGV